MPARGQAMKRPAAAQATRAPLAKQSKKSMPSARDLVAQHCLTISAEFRGDKERRGFLSSAVREMLRYLTKGKAHTQQDTSMAALESVLTGVDDELQGIVCELQDKVDGADSNREAREKVQVAMEAMVGAIEKDILDRKAALASSHETAKVAKDFMTKAKAERKSGCTAMKTVECKKVQLDTVKQSYGALKLDGPEGSKWQNQLKHLRKVGKELGFHEVLLDAVPAVLRKQPAKRKTFDGITLDQLEKEFSKHTCVLDAAFLGEELALQQHLAAVQKAHESFSNAEEQHRESANDLEHVEKAFTAAKAKLVAAKEEVRSFKPDMRRATRDLRCALTRLSDFRCGPLAAFEALQAHLREHAIVQYPASCSSSYAARFATSMHPGESLGPDAQPWLTFRGELSVGDGGPRPQACYVVSETTADICCAPVLVSGSWAGTTRSAPSSAGLMAEADGVDTRCDRK